MADKILLSIAMFLLGIASTNMLRSVWPRKPKVRYFIVFYKAPHSSGYNMGNVSFICKEAEYISNESVCEYIKKKYPDTKAVLVTNIIELSEADYKCWVTKYGNHEQKV